MPIYSKLNLFVAKQEHVNLPFNSKWPSYDKNRWELMNTTTETENYRGYYSNANVQLISNAINRAMALEHVYNGSIIATSDYAHVTLFYPDEWKQNP